jgi:hypothetical protein
MQSTKNILLVKPSQFVFNTETSTSNAFQQKPTSGGDQIKLNAINEFDLFVATLQAKGVNTFVFNDTNAPIKPDAVFPNNWVTFHSDGTVILYPMCAVNRRHERRADILDTLKANFNITKIIDISFHEKENRFLEGTGSIVFDHNNKIAYACLSPRTNKYLFIETMKQVGYNPVYFNSCDEKGKDIYHTNVMMNVAEKFAVICLNSILDKKERETVTHSLTNTGHLIIDISFKQINHFAGNMLTVLSDTGKSLTVLSQTAFNSLTEDQKKEIEKYSELTPIPIPTIETIGGGSARCMMAEIFLQKHK